MAAGSAEPSLVERLLLGRYSRNAPAAAIRGEEIPHALGHPLHRLCVIRGIRYHRGFGEELRGLLFVFTRALNARSIMSNIIPNFESPEEVPYCIWHPQLASEETYREVARRYPFMAYQVGRACAVAGYTDLYHELGLLPDVHIAEEARECSNVAIYQAIVTQPVRYSIMNDYTRSIDVDSRQPAHLNGDTAVHWMLNVKQEFTFGSSAFIETNGKLVYTEMIGYNGYRDKTFNVTEDMNIDEFETDEVGSRQLASRAEMELLYEPLPADLPTVQKDVLIVMAAYLGDVDRYARLRRPTIVYGEIVCCVRGIYHNTFFAIWWSKQTQHRHFGAIEAAINARFLMNNVLSRAPFRKYHIPYLIWWPTVAAASTYRFLAKLQPEMLPQITRACIYAGYKDLFDELLPQVTPDEDLMLEAEHQGNLHYRQALKERVDLLGIVPQRPPDHLDWKLEIPNSLGLSSSHVTAYLSPQWVGQSGYAPYDGRECDASIVEMMACLPDPWKVPAGDELGWRELDYVEWPPELPRAAESEQEQG